MAYYPIMLNITNKKCLVIGGGNVAYRKILSLLEFGGTVTAIAPKFIKDIWELSKNNRIELIDRKYQKNDVQNYNLVIVATNDKMLNKEISKECIDNNIPVNVVDDKELSTFITPSVIRRGDLTISISTNGKSPLLSRRIREMLENVIVEEFCGLISELSSTRVKLKSSSMSLDEKIKLYDDIIRKSNLLKRDDK
ncbi:precorrin-2 dehydrogenase/sirohydrochlorin ferrochelatase family protein [Thermoanaerobacterium thermosaccharolyticum]|uniref:precorrin-2 dehydrogenase n=2 Tax=Thermoanaerobacterium thermosaccharolyticum TaxID=1517 RepID=D9TPE5_THETC|nr:bifunctional precorrin-2 dehydrogenase/sirohydrochlorin ferrochelatase [Thermoanaerobacterium thermosaccharolyticum]ADL69105.1 siroheme synthase [Thermoanaerobacterium thermosaccharolyticum DSM 571]AST58843.1 siroheme synthase [Thermoanaerobacterium thermosaccharolyticum]KAA5807166.1 bifunctional precorrin-2 dehydrogenase/sirohydrochlorin ferrochelatase [Thermoanaerobacterium thermosaccharolyticum]MBE0069422.1 bifunctional precorrin-2 dehydrogenase/sirohydrochlorin ferrochelatase [Thermoanae